MHFGTAIAFKRASWNKKTNRSSKQWLKRLFRKWNSLICLAIFSLYIESSVSNHKNGYTLKGRICR